MSGSEQVLVELNVAEHEMAEAALQFAAAHRRAHVGDEQLSEMLRARDALLEAVDHFDTVEAAYFMVVEPPEDEA